MLHLYGSFLTPQPQVWYVVYIVASWVLPTRTAQPIIQTLQLWEAL